MLTIAFLCVLYFALLTGIGLLVPLSLFRKKPNFKHLVGAFWLGWALVTGFLQIWQIFFPIGPVSLAFLVAGALAGWLLCRREVWAWVSGLPRYMALFLGALACGMVLLLSNQVLFAQSSPDHGLYHTQTLLWFTSYKLPPGLVNLHYRLAFNHAGFLFAAQIENGFLPGLAYYVTHPLLFGALLLYTASGLYAFLSAPHPIRQKDLAAAFLLLVTLKYAGEMQFAGFAPDRMIFVIQIVLALAVLDLFEKSPEAESFFEYKAAYAILWIGFGLVTKLSFAVFGLMAALAVALAWGMRKGWAIRANIRPGLYAAGLMALWVVPWLVRGGIMSGYPLFPSDVLSIPVNWRMAPEEAAAMTGIITNWARTCSNTMPLESGKLWLLIWKDCMPPQFWELSFMIGLLGGAAALLLRLPNSLRNSRPNPRPALVLGAISLVSLAFWLWFGPDYRFAGAALWLLLLAVLLFLAEQAASLLPAAAYLKALVVFTLIFLVWLSPNQYALDVQKKTFLYPPPAFETARASRSAPLELEIISRPMPGGGVLYSPALSGEGCWNAPLPCTQLNDVHPRLTLFDADHLDAGFYIAPPTEP